ncbi:hypothetical protein PQQ87_08730 [Paraburkholderia nemoris]|uniref:hypothetical protein n=1 Tax=Paraburkholderia nemoris TaxID=2793076 RepID=UPI0038BDCBEC
MEANSKAHVHGALTLILKREDGSNEVIHKDNIIVQNGFDFICDAIGNAGSRPACMGYIALGTGTATPAAGDTALGTEVSRLAATYAHTEGTQQFSFTATFNPGVATAALTEAGVFNAASGGTMFDHVSFPVVNKGANDTLTAVFTFTLS